MSTFNPGATSGMPTHPSDTVASRERGEEQATLPARSTFRNAPWGGILAGTAVVASAAAFFSLGEKGNGSDIGTDNGALVSLPHVANYEGPLKNFLTGELTADRISHKAAIGTPYNVSIPDLLADGKIVVLDFWAPWCVNCPRVTEHLHGAAAKYPNVVVVSVTPDPTESISKWLVRSQGLPAVPQSIILTGGQAIQDYFEPQFGKFGFPAVIMFDQAGFASKNYVFWDTRKQPLSDIDAALKRLNNGSSLASNSESRTWYIPGAAIGDAKELISGTVVNRPPETAQYSVPHLNDFTAGLVKSGLHEPQLAELRAFYRNNLPGYYDRSGTLTQWNGDEKAREQWVARTAALFNEPKTAPQARVLADDLVRIASSDPSAPVRMEAVQAFRLKLRNEADLRVIDILTPPQKEALFNAAFANLAPEQPREVRMGVAQLLNNFAFRAVLAGRWSPELKESLATRLRDAFTQEQEPAIKYVLFRTCFAAEKGNALSPEDSQSAYVSAFQEWGAESPASVAKYKWATAFYDRMQKLEPAALNNPATLQGFLSEIESRQQKAGDKGSLDQNGMLALGQICLKVAALSQTGNSAWSPEAKRLVQSELAAYVVAWTGKDFSLEASLSESLAGAGVDSLDGGARSLLLSRLPTIENTQFYPQGAYLLRFMLEERGAVSGNALSQSSHP